MFVIDAVGIRSGLEASMACAFSRPRVTRHADCGVGGRKYAGVLFGTLLLGSFTDLMRMVTKG